MSVQQLEEFGDYLLARGRINGWRTKEEGRHYPRTSLVGMIQVSRKPCNYIEVTDGGVGKIMQLPKEDLPRALLEATNTLVKWYIEEKLKEA